MTTQEVAAMIEEIGLPFCYYQFPDGTATAPPFVAFFCPAEDGLFADNITYTRRATLVIELYSDDKDFTHEEAIEAILDAHDLPWEKDSTYLGDERLYMTTFTTSVLLTPSNPPTTAVTT